MTTATEYTSETAKYRHLTTRYCKGAGIDIASQGDPVVPWAWNLDLPAEKFAWYNSNHPPRGPIQLRGDALAIPVDSGSLDFVYASHILEDYEHWDPALIEWTRCLRPGGNLIILIPEKALWKAALDNGQPPNDMHRHEGTVGELTDTVKKLELPLLIVEDRLTDCFPGDYSILFVAQKLTPNGAN